MILKLDKLDNIIRFSKYEQICLDIPLVKIFARLNLHISRLINDENVIFPFYLFRHTEVYQLYEKLMEKHLEKLIASCNCSVEKFEALLATIK